ncbi:hypothetical protein MMC27_004369 [Xylographa pallens]|nr:hypothetical protein [Xylographa pallens]
MADISETFTSRFKQASYSQIPTGRTPEDANVDDGSWLNYSQEAQHLQNYDGTEYRGFSEHTEKLVPEQPLASDAAPWLPGILRHVPWLGFTALGISASMMAVTVAILVTSNRSPVTNWSIQPTVYLAVATAVANFTLQLAFANGVTISWWYKALQGGTISDLHHYWSFGTLLCALTRVANLTCTSAVGNGFISIFTAGRSFNKIAFAAVCVALAVIDGPLLQRASTIISRDVTVPITLNVSIAQQLPKGYTSLMLGRIDEPVVLTAQFAQVMKHYNARNPIRNGFRGCNGSCTATVPAAGFSVNCSNPLGTPVDYNPIISNDTKGSVGSNTQPIFTTNLTWSSGFGHSLAESHSPEQVILTVGYSNTTNCSGTFYTTICTLTEAVVEYQVSLVNESVALASTATNLIVVAIGNSTSDVVGGYDAGQNVTLGGFSLAGNDLFGAHTSQSFVGAAGLFQLNDLDTFASQYIVNFEFVENCQYTWKDPTDDILLALHEIMFRTAISAANVSAFSIISTPQGNLTLPTNMTIPALQTFAQNVYSSHFAFLGGALTVMALGIASVLPTFNGWWHLGRQMTLSPIETAKAFNAPILTTEHPHSNVEVNQLVREVGSRQVRYGEVTTVTSISSINTRLDERLTPQKGVGVRRLEMGPPADVMMPRKGTIFDI